MTLKMYLKINIIKIYGLCDGPIPRPEESYRMCVVRCVINRPYLHWVRRKRPEYESRKKQETKKVVLPPHRN